MHKFTEGDISFFAVDNQTRKAEVFFNPSRDFDRDLNVLFIRTLGKKGMLGIDLFSGSGIRGLRLAKETTAFSKMILNDIKTRETIKKNIAQNKVQGTKLISTDINAANINLFEEGFDYIDMDPFGSPVRFFATSLQKLRYGGILALTATDSAPLYGKAQKACILKYGARSFKTQYYNEVGLRILIKRAEEIANIYERSLEPLLFDVRRHYLRAYLMVKKPDSSRPIGFIYQCKKCPYRTTASNSSACPNCRSELQTIGPLWLGKLFSRDLVMKMAALAENNRVSRYLENLKKEEDIISYYTSNEMASYLKTKEIPSTALGSRTVFDPKGFRTTKDIKELINEWKTLLADG